MKIIVVVEPKVGYPIELFDNCRKEVEDYESKKIDGKLITLSSDKVLCDINDLVIIDYESSCIDVELDETVYICKQNIGKYNNVEVNKYHVKGLEDVNKIMILEIVYSEINWG